MTSSAHRSRRRVRATLLTTIVAGASLTLAGAATAAPVIGGPTNAWTSTPVYPVTQAPANPLFPTYTWQVNAGPIQAAQPFGAAPPIPAALGDGQYLLRAYEGGLGTPGRVAAKNIFIDRNPPAVSLAFVPAAANVQFGGAKNVSFACVAGVGSPLASCTATIGGASYPNGGALPTNSLGTKTVVVTGVDVAGNTATISKAYTVVDTIAPTAPTLVSPLDPTGDATPTFQWIASSDGAGSGVKNYQLKVLNAAGATVVDKTINHPSVSHTPSALPNGNYTWVVTAVDKGNNDTSSSTGSFLIDSGEPAPPTLSGPGSGTGAHISDPTPTFSVGGTGPGFAWTIEDDDGDAVDAGILTAPGEVTASNLDDGDYSFHAVQVSVTGNASSEEVYVFTVDTVSPKAVNVWGRPVSPGARPNPVFSWTGPEPDINYTWNVSKAGKVVQGPVTTPGGQANLKPLAAGAYQFSVTSQDLASNSGPAVKVPFVIEGLPAPTTKKIATTGGAKKKSLVIRTRNTGKLKPKVGRTLTTKRPLLTWKKTTRDTVLYNLQVFAVKGDKLVKVYSTFPRGPRFRVPNRRLGFGQTYVWQVFAYRGPAKGYLAKPIGISWFKTKKKAPKRLLLPKAPRAKAGKALTVRWKAAPKARYYRVDLVRGSKRVWARRTTSRKVVVPAAKLKAKGTYKLIIRRGNAGNAKGKSYAKGAWVGQRLKVSS